ncbi:MAG: hypothetical protein H6873_13695 [Hyphomicrobiaceae bacterium]|nr:hypothetical protein [Hyphomicrobiaceae bacterium]
MQRRTVLKGMALAPLAAAATTLPALAATEVLLGTRTVNLLADHDTIYVGLLQGLFTHIRLTVSGNGILLYDLSVNFVNGQSVSLPVRTYIEDGGTTRYILLPGVLRAIRTIDMTYQRILGGGQAVVSVYGTHP